MAATERARDDGRLEPFRDAVMDAYWRDQQDIESPAVLAAAAEAVGLDPDAIISAATDAGYLARVARAREQAHDDNVSGIPTLLVGGFPIVGCQLWETYELVMDKLGVGRRTSRET